jgi:hypothetical protein
VSGRLSRHEEIGLVFQSALLGAIGPQLRAIMVSNDETSIHFDCYLDGEIDEVDRESMSIVETEIQAAFPAAHQITHTVHRLDYPAVIPASGWLVCFRREEGQWLAGLHAPPF